MLLSLLFGLLAGPALAGLPAVAAQTAPVATPTTSDLSPGANPTLVPGASLVISVSPAPAPTQSSASQADLLLLQAQLQNQAQQLQNAQQDAFDAKNSAAAAVTLSLIAILFGIVGLVVGTLAVLRSRSRSNHRKQNETGENTLADSSGNGGGSEIEAG